MMKEREVILTAKDLKKYYTVDRGMLSHKVKGTVKAVDGLNFQIFRNETLGVIGESGCGKSTLARVTQPREALRALVRPSAPVCPEKCGSTCRWCFRIPILLSTRA